MKFKPVRVCDVSRVLRISSSSLIDFLRDKGFRVIHDYLSPLSGRMVEIIQNGYHEGPPFEELNPMLVQAEVWEKANPDTVTQLHTPPPPPKYSEELKELRQRRKRGPRFSFAPLHPPQKNSGRLPVTPLDLELIHRMLALSDESKIIVRDYLRRKTILKAISQME